MRQHLSLREHFRRGNALLSRLPRYTLFAIRRYNVLAGQRGGPVDLLEHGDFVRVDMNIGGRRQTDQRDRHKHYSERQ
jgi:hypothetical protein